MAEAIPLPSTDIDDYPDLEAWITARDRFVQDTPPDTWGRPHNYKPTPCTCASVATTGKPQAWAQLEDALRARAAVEALQRVQLECLKSPSEHNKGPSGGVEVLDAASQSDESDSSDKTETAPARPQPTHYRAGFKPRGRSVHRGLVRKTKTVSLFAAAAKDGEAFTLNEEGAEDCGRPMLPRADHCQTQ